MNDQLCCPVCPCSTVVVSLTLFFNYPDCFAGGLLINVLAPAAHSILPSCSSRLAFTLAADEPTCHHYTVLSVKDRRITHLGDFCPRD